MGFNVHRNGDLRACGASTIVINQSSVFINGRLVAVAGDPCTHGNGQLIGTSPAMIRYQILDGGDIISSSEDVEIIQPEFARDASVNDGVYIGNRRLISTNDTAQPDDDGHTNTQPVSGSQNVFAHI